MGTGYCTGYLKLNSDAIAMGTDSFFLIITQKMTFFAESN